MTPMLSFLLAALCQIAPQAGQSTARSKPSEAGVAGKRLIELSLHNGRLSLIELVRKSLDAYGLDGSKLDFKDQSLPMEGLKGLLFIKGLDLALGGTAKIEKNKDGTKLRIEIDRWAMRAYRQKGKHKLLRLLSRLTGEDLVSRQYRLTLPGALPKGRPLVLLIHGLDQSPHSLKVLRTEIEGAGFATASFSYPNDEAIDRCGDALAKELRELAKEKPKLRIAIVAHSMGGLVARQMLEIEGNDPGNVQMLIMLGTPNHGSYLAALRPVLDVYRFVKRGADKEAFFSVLKDGFGEAGRDLVPGSAFLTKLNKNGRNPRVSYRAVLGSKGLLEEKALKSLREWLLRAIQRKTLTATIQPMLQKALDDLDEVLAGKGDSAVAVKRGRLADVESVVVPMSHRGMVRKLAIAPHSKPPVQPAIAAVLRWLRTTIE